MKLNLARTTLGLILFASLVAVAPTSQARSCSLHRVSGRYGYTTNGTIPTLGAVAAVGQVTLDASGNLTGAQTASFNGAIVPETLSGTYTVNADCTGTATVNVYHSGVLARTTNLNVIYDDNERELRAIFLTAGTVLTIQGKRQFSDEED
jgi:seryl-tRNA(Sec) selenium transferase